MSDAMVKLEVETWITITQTGSDLRVWKFTEEEAITVYKALHAHLRGEVPAL